MISEGKFCQIFIKTYVFKENLYYGCSLEDSNENTLHRFL